MTNLTVTCGSCGAAFEVDARKAGQSVPCANCHVRTDVPGVLAATVPGVLAATGRENVASQSPPKKIADLAARAFAGLPAPAKLAVVGLACLTIGYWVGVARMTAVRYSAADMQAVSNRATVAEQSLATMTGKYTAMEAERSRYKVAAESREKDVASIRQRMNELRAEKGVPEWASAEAWAKAKEEIAAAQKLTEKNADLEKRHAADRREITRLRSDLAAIAEKRSAKKTASDTRHGADDGEEKAAAELAAERFVKGKLSHPSTAKFPFFGQAAKRNGDGSWTVVGKVSARNSFNLEATFDYACQMTREKDGWRLVDCLLTESAE